jgi:hypothetical protein
VLYKAVLRPLSKTPSKREFWKDSAEPESRSARHCSRDPCPVLAMKVGKIMVLRWCLPFTKLLLRRVEFDPPWVNQTLTLSILACTPLTSLASSVFKFYKTFW